MVQLFQITIWGISNCFSMRCSSDLVQIHLTITSDHLLSGFLQLVVELVKFRLVCDICTKASELDVLGINLLIYMQVLASIYQQVQLGVDSVNIFQLLSICHIPYMAGIDQLVWDIPLIKFVQYQYLKNFGAATDVIYVL